MFVWQLLDFWPAWRLWRSLHFAPHLMMIAIILVGQVSCSCAASCFAVLVMHNQTAMLDCKGCRDILAMQACAPT